jgi:hypothetical protein
MEEFRKLPVSIKKAYKLLGYIALSFGAGYLIGYYIISQIF